MKIELVLEDGSSLFAYASSSPQVGDMVTGVDGVSYMIDFKEPQHPDSEHLKVQASPAHIDC